MIKISHMQISILLYDLNISNKYNTVIVLSFYLKTNRERGGTRYRRWLRHCATSRKVAGSIPDEVIVFFS
jgi:hypothetical protein